MTYNAQGVPLGIYAILPFAERIRHPYVFTYLEYNDPNVNRINSFIFNSFKTQFRKSFR